MSFAPYQIDYSVQNKAKTLGFSKKKVLFKFGFANPTALSNNEVGPACRGSEHEITFIWSLSSGKRQLFVDGKEIHYSESGLNGWTSDRSWQHAFTLRDTTVGARHALKVHFMSQPANKEIPGSRPFDLRIAGASYFTFNQLYELGTSSMRMRGSGSSPRGYHGSDEAISPEERRLIAQAKVESLKDLQHQQRANPVASASSASMSHQEGNLIDFGAPPQPVAQVAGAPSHNQFTSSVTLDPSFDEQRQPPAPMLTQSPYGGVPQLPPAAAAPPQGFTAPQQNYGNLYGYPPAPTANGSYPHGAPIAAPHGAAQQASAPVVANSSPYAPPAATGNALTTFQGAPGYPAPSSYAVNPASSAPGYPNDYAFAQATLPSHAPAGYPPQQQQHQMSSPGAYSTNTFGSAPSFAQPPKQPQTQPNFGAPQPYGAPPAGGFGGY